MGKVTGSQGISPLGLCIAISPFRPTMHHNLNYQTGLLFSALLILNQFLNVWCSISSIDVTHKKNIFASHFYFMHHRFAAKNQCRAQILNFHINSFMYYYKIVHIMLKPQMSSTGYWFSWYRFVVFTLTWNNE